MKQIKFLSVAVAAILLLLTSCLGNSGGNSGSFTSFGKVRFASSRLVMDIPGFDTVYSSQFLTLDLDPDQWYYVSVEYDMDSPENANAAENGYISVTLLAAPSQVPIGLVNADGTNLEEPMEGEIVMTAAMTGADYILDDLLIESNYSTLTDQKDQFFLVFDPTQEPTEENGITIYNAYVRVKTITEGKSPTLTGRVLNVYKANYIMQSIESTEKNKGKSTYGIKFHYVKEIDKETGELTWASNDVRIFQISTTSN